MQTYYRLIHADGRIVIDNVVPVDADVIAECDAYSWLEASKQLPDLD
ncbi:hypothetical protein [Jeongeupia chitinilytica]|uniref:Uncharacterized protein n=1 Tax=Jeongeupia chitinilytica TaxID=1041641 RepID=A0ABQ3H0X1_9NEIS|nr:hypothetical protein [Jeongeupia chitinilytica]GHD60338.1 hypothetical protein GCM10007350_13220 [Jeongeupia chitinilytica]